MTDAVNDKAGSVRLDRTINLGHIISVVMTLAAIIGGWATLDSRVAGLERDTRAMKIDSRDAAIAAEVRLQNRITETQARTSDDIREIKSLLRENFRDLDVKLEKKADRPGVR